MSPDTNIILTSLNARYIHTSLGLRYLYANMASLQDQTELLEFTIKRPTNEIVEQLIARKPKIIGFGIYIWNIDQSLKVIKQLKRQAPEIIIILGGPQVSHEPYTQAIFHTSDYLLSGQADLVFKELCQHLLEHQSYPEKHIKAPPFKLAQLELPYPYYTDEDIAKRIIYVEASRGCPFKCEFCLSSLDKTAYPFNLDLFLEQVDHLYQRGARQFKFVDRTFNLKVASSVQILDFFLKRIDENLFLHFELIPDNLPEALKQRLPKFPANTLQFEIGIQSFTAQVQSLISRRQDNEKAKRTITWLKQNTQAHLHTDLIFGLPGETLTSFADSFNELIALEPHEIQLGILKKLPGAPIARHTDTHKIHYNHRAPYEIISSALIDKNSTTQIKHMAKFWDLVANSGRFKHSLSDLLGSNAFGNFLKLSEFLYHHFNRTHSIHLFDLFNQVEIFMSQNQLKLSNVKKDIKHAQYRQKKNHGFNKRQRQHQHRDSQVN